MRSGSRTGMPPRAPPNAIAEPMFSVGGRPVKAFVVTCPTPPATPPPTTAAATTEIPAAVSAAAVGSPAPGAAVPATAPIPTEDQKPWGVKLFPAVAQYSTPPVIAPAVAPIARTANIGTIFPDGSVNRTGLFSAY